MAGRHALPASSAPPDRCTPSEPSTQPTHPAGGGVTVLPAPGRHRRAPEPVGLLAGPPWRVVVPVVAAVVALSTVGTAVAAVARTAGPTERVVSVRIDGDLQQVSTSATTVAGLFAEHGWSLSAHDVVSPALGQPLPTTDVVWQRGRRVTLDLDGHLRTVWTTTTDVSGLLDSLGIQVGHSYLSTTQDAALPVSGTVLELRTPKLVTVVADGRRFSRWTTASSVSEVLAAAGIHLAATDLTSVPADALPATGQVVLVTRVRQVTAYERVAVPVLTTRRTSTALRPGQTRIVTAGRAGSITRQWVLTYVNGRRTARRLVASVTVTDMAPRVVLVGVAAPGSSQQRRIGYQGETTGPWAIPADHPNWGALAKCESGGRPRAVSEPGKKYFGLYQFDLSTWHAWGGTGNPINASPAEQTYRAQLLYDNRGRKPWPVCGKYL